MILYLGGLSAETQLGMGCTRRKSFQDLIARELTEITNLKYRIVVSAHKYRHRMSQDSVPIDCPVDSRPEDIIYNCY